MYLNLFVVDFPVVYGEPNDLYDQLFGCQLDCSVGELNKFDTELSLGDCVLVSITVFSLHICLSWPSINLVLIDLIKWRHQLSSHCAG